MKAKYVGHPDYRDETPRITAFGGVTFRRSLFVPIPANFDEKLLAKLRANPAFEVVDKDLTGAEQEALEAAETASPVNAPAAPAADAKSLDKPALLARLGELKEKHPDAEIVFDEKMGAAKLRSILEEALFIIGEDE